PGASLGVGREDAAGGPVVVALLGGKHLLVEPVDRHLADDVIRLRLISAVHNVSFLLISEDSRCGCATVNPIGSDSGAVQLDQRQLDLADVLSPRTRHYMCRVRYGSRFEIRIVTEQSRLKGHKSLLMKPPNK